MFYRMEKDVIKKLLPEGRFALIGEHFPLNQQRYYVQLIYKRANVRSVVKMFIVKQLVQQKDSSSQKSLHHRPFYSLRSRMSLR